MCLMGSVFVADGDTMPCVHVLTLGPTTFWGRIPEQYTSLYSAVPQLP